MIVILYKINEIYIKKIRTYFKNLVSLNLLNKNLFRLNEKIQVLIRGFLLYFLGCDIPAKFQLHCLIIGRDILTTVFVDTRFLENKTPAETFPKFPSIIHVIDRSDRNPPITAGSMTCRRSEGHTSGCNWWISIRSVDNTRDWRKF